MGDLRKPEFLTCPHCGHHVNYETKKPTTFFLTFFYCLGCGMIASFNDRKCGGLTGQAAVDAFKRRVS